MMKKSSLAPVLIVAIIASAFAVAPAGADQGTVTVGFGFAERASTFFGFDTYVDTAAARRREHRRRRLVNITMSFHRYCQQDMCTFDQFAYVRLRPPGPTLPPSADNPRGIIDVRPGDRIVWTYNDFSCDFEDGDGGGPSPVFCPGHNVIFEDGSVRSPLLRARKFPRDDFSWTVPKTATKGSKIRYFCEPRGITLHWEGGMTGILRIV